MNEWISVKDSLPEYDVHVLAWDGDDQFVAYRYFIEEGRAKRVVEYFKSVICTCCDDRYDGDIIHWMPLPENPDE